MLYRRGKLQSFVYAAAGLGTAVAGKAAIDDTGSSWPTILVVVGLFVAVTGIRDITRLAQRRFDRCILRSGTHSRIDGAAFCCGSLRSLARRRHSPFVAYSLGVAHSWCTLSVREPRSGVGGKSREAGPRSLSCRRA